MMRVGLPVAAYRNNYQTASKLLWLNFVVVRVRGKDIIKSVRCVLRRWAQVNHW